MRAFALLLFLATPVLLVGAAMSPGPGTRQLAAFYPPWWSGRRTAEAAATAGSIISGGRWPGVLVMRSAAPDLAASLRRSGALIVLDIRGVGLCSAAASGGKSLGL